MPKARTFIGAALMVISMQMLAGAVGLCDYTSPETDLSNLALSFSYRYFDDGATEGLDQSGGRAVVDFSQLHDSPEVGFSLAASGELVLEDLLPVGGLGEASGTFRYYLSQDAPVFGFGGLAATFATGQPQPGINLSAGVGYGRFSDVTPLAKAFVIQKELLKARAFENELDDATLLGVAELIGKEATYATINDLAAAVVALIQAATGATIAPRQVLMVEDVIAATGDDLNCGWAVQAGVGYELLDPYDGARDILLTVSGDAAFAPDPQSQFLCRASFTGPFDILDENTLLARASYARTLSETSSLTATYAIQRIQPRGLAADTSHALTLVLGFVVGKADVGLQVSLSKAATAPAWTVDVSISASMDLL